MSPTRLRYRLSQDVEFATGHPAKAGFAKCYAWPFNLYEVEFATGHPAKAGFAKCYAWPFNLYEVEFVKTIQY